MTEEWVVYRRLVDGLLNREPKRDWDRFFFNHPDTVKNFYELIATGLTEDQAQTMVELSRSDE